MKALFICSKSPYPPIEGGALAMYNMITGLLDKGVKVKVLCISTPKFPVDIEKIPAPFLQNTGFEYVHFNASPGILSAFLNLFSKRSYHISRFTSNAFRKAVEKVLSEDTYQVIQLEGLFVTQYSKSIRRYSKAAVVYRSHNIEHLIWERHAETEKNFLKKIYLRLQAKRLRKYESSLTEKVDAVAAITAKDSLYYRQQKPTIPVVDVPFGINEPDRDYRDIPREIPSLFFLGSLNWLPNSEGLRWFITNVWPEVHSRLPALKFYIAGRHAPAWLLKINNENLFVVGEVEDALAFMHSKMLMTVPLFSGSGMRIKIIEGMYAANTVVSTTVGAEGIECVHGKDILIADTADSFAEEIIKCIRNPFYARTIALEGKNTILKKYSNERIMDKVLQFYNELIR